MLQIKINNIGLDLFADTALQFELNNPAYFGSDSDLLAASLVFSFDLPLSANNRVLLRQPQMIGSTEPFLENENTELRNENDILRRIEREYKELIKQNLQSSKTTLQYTYAITGAILGSGAVLVCPMSSN